MSAAEKPKGRLPYEAREYTSYSEIAQAEICLEKHWHLYINQTEPMHRGVNLPLGGSVHKALAEYYTYKKKVGSGLPGEEVLDTFRAAWKAEMDEPVPIHFGNSMDAGKAVDQGVALLNAFLEVGDDREVLAVEQPFTVALVHPVTGEVHEKQLKGYIDLIAETSANGVTRPVIVEHKTAARRYDTTRKQHDKQLTIYRMGAAGLGHRDPDLEYQLLLKLKTPVVERVPIVRSARDEREAMFDVFNILKAIDAGIHWRTRGWACADCPYRYKCDAA